MDTNSELKKIVKNLQERVEKLEKIVFSVYPNDELFEEAIKTIKAYDSVSADLLQRRLRIGYARAARMLDELEQGGYVGPGDGAKPREVLAK